MFLARLRCMLCPDASCMSEIIHFSRGRWKMMPPDITMHWRNFTVIALCRNPYDRAWSMYTYSRCKRFATFRRFLHDPNVCAPAYEGDKYNTHIYSLQTNLFFLDGMPLFDELIPLEQIEQRIPRFLGKNSWGQCSNHTENSKARLKGKSCQTAFCAKIQTACRHAPPNSSCCLGLGHFAQDLLMLPYKPGCTHRR